MFLLAAVFAVVVLSAGTRIAPFRGLIMASCGAVIGISAEREASLAAYRAQRLESQKRRQYEMYRLELEHYQSKRLN